MAKSKTKSKPGSEFASACERYHSDIEKGLALAQLCGTPGQAMAIAFGLMISVLTFTGMFENDLFGKKKTVKAKS
jgi:hypothetical protein